MFYPEIIRGLQRETDEVLLLHSGTGKDSLMLMDVLSKSFNRVQPVFMYFIKGLEYENNYIRWAEKRYKVEFIQTPHFAVYSYIKYGYLGIKKDPKQTLMTIAKIDTMMKERTGIAWSVYGFKKIDG